MTVFVQLELEELELEELDVSVEEDLSVELSSSFPSSSFSRFVVRLFKVEISPSTSFTAVSKPASISLDVFSKVFTTQETALIMSPAILNGSGNLFPSESLLLAPVQSLFPGVGSPPSELRRSSANGRMPLIPLIASSACDF